MKLFILPFILFAMSASGQLYSRLSKQYYSPFSESSSTLRRIPKSIKEEVVYRVEKSERGIDTLQRKLTTVLEYNKDNQVSISRQFQNDVETFETEYLLRDNFYGLSTRQFQFVNKKRELSQETESTKLSGKTYVSSHLRYGYTTANKYDTTLNSLTTYFYYNDLEKELITEKSIYISSESDDDNRKEISQFDYNGNLVTYNRQSDSTFVTYYYPFPAFYKSQNPQLSLPDSVISYVQKKGKVRYYATVYSRNKYKDAVKIENYSWEYGQTRVPESEITNLFEYDPYGNWTKWQMVKKNANESSEVNTRSFTTRHFTY